MAINIPSPCNNPKPRKTKVDTAHVTFLTDANVLEKIQKQQDEKKSQEQQVILTLHCLYIPYVRLYCNFVLLPVRSPMCVYLLCLCIK